MRIVMFYHSLVSDWNHGNAHFLRGVASELLARGHDVRIYEPTDGWSVHNLLLERGDSAIAAFHGAYPMLFSHRYDPRDPPLDVMLDGADLVLVHEWNTPELVGKIGAARARSRSFRLLFHDTHHRAISAPDEIASYDLRDYDGVLAFGEVLRLHYLMRGLTEQAFTWHEAADTRVFHPRIETERDGGLVWIGNWGDDERDAELREYLIEPIRALGMHACLHGVRYPAAAEALLREAGARYCGFLHNFEAPERFAAHDVTVHVPRRFYLEALPGIPTIRVFEALACGIPLVCAPWNDAEGLFRPGQDYLVARDAREMTQHLRAVVSEPGLASSLRASGLETIRARHTCAHRVDELFEIVRSLESNT